jgi:uncharacterized membrane protein
VAKPAKPEKKPGHLYNAAGWFISGLLVAGIAWDVRQPNNVEWNDDAWWPLFGLAAIGCWLMAVRALSLWARERQAAEDAGKGAA